MKNNQFKFVMIAALVMVSTGVFAQAQLAIGIKGGPNFAKLDGTDASGTYKSRTGWHGGAFALFKFSKIGVQPEVLFSQQGSKIKVNQNDLEQNYSYVNVPIIVKLYTVAGINLQVGPQFGFVTKAERDEVDINGIKTTQDVKDRLKGSDVSLALGAGWDLPFGLTLDARYNLGLSKIDDNDPSSQDVKNQVWQISLGYKLIKLGK